jgi:hypothetical protein
MNARLSALPELVGWISRPLSAVAQRAKAEGVIHHILSSGREVMAGYAFANLPALPLAAAHTAPEPPATIFSFSF